MSRIHHLMNKVSDGVLRKIHSHRHRHERFPQFRGTPITVKNTSTGIPSAKLGAVKCCPFASLLLCSSDRNRASPPKSSVEDGHARFLHTVGGFTKGVWRPPHSRQPFKVTRDEAKLASRLEASTAKMGKLDREAENYGGAYRGSLLPRSGDDIIVMSNTRLCSIS
jgi:hypothetical protein